MLVTIASNGIYTAPRVLRYYLDFMFTLYNFYFFCKICSRSAQIQSDSRVWHFLTLSHADYDKHKSNIIKLDSMRWFSHRRRTGGRHNCINYLLTDVVGGDSKVE